MKAHLTLAFALLLVCTGAAMAQTPDWMTPSQETICDNESGAAYGLCNAYCEAMDCELANDNDPGTAPKASDTACSKVRNKFQQTAGRDLPCEVQCPCNDPAVSPLFAQIVAGDIPLSICATNFFELQDGVVVGNESQPLAIAGLISEDVYICAALDGQAAPLTPAQGALCVDLLEQAAANQGVTCEPLP
ncbi:MAG TPA: hypothetical protein VLQ45_09650 [Thermoanaerobaculia bacterium]|nr:hypothetical protein [Thermoanaerobaculia bacterium]